MKKGESLLNAFENIDDKFILECEKNDKRENKIIYLSKNIFNMHSITKLVGFAACAVLLITGGVMLNRNLILNNDKELVQIANPIMEVESFEKLQSYFNTTIPKLDKKVDSYIAIGTNGYAGHARIRYSDGTSFEMDLTSEDASGISGGILIKEEKINGITVKFYNYDGINYTNWTKNKISYSYQNNGGEINETELEELLNQ